MLKLLIVALLVSGCSIDARKRINFAGAALTAASLAVDACQTVSTAHGHWANGMEETGAPTRALIGAKPSEQAVEAYFAVSTVAVLAVAQAIPEKYRWIAYGAVTAIEGETIRGNLATTNCAGIGR